MRDFNAFSKTFLWVLNFSKRAILVEKIDCIDRVTTAILVPFLLLLRKIFAVYLCRPNG